MSNATTHSDYNGNSKYNFNANSPHDFAAHVEHRLGLDALAPDQEQYGGYAFINDDTIVARSPITGLRPVIEQAIKQIVGNNTLEQAAKKYGGYDNLESKIAQQLTQLNDWANLTQETQNEVMILTGINFDAMTTAEQEASINHLQHSPLPFGDIKEVLAESVTIDMGFTHTLDKNKTVSEHMGDGIYKVSMISNNNNGSHTGHNLGSFLVDMNKYAQENADGQYATSATASSSYSNTQTKLSGKPDGSPWYSKTNSTGDVVIELNYKTATKVEGIELVGTASYATGHVTKVELQDENGNWHTVWTGDETSTKADKTLELSFDATDFNTQNARVTVDTSQGAAYQSIDAVKLVSAQSAEDDGSGREAKAIEIGNQMVKNTNNNNELYLDGSAQDILYGRTEQLDFSSMESGHGEGGVGTGHHFTEHVGHMFHEGMLVETQEAYGGYSFINDNHIIARSPITGLQPVVEQAIDQIVGNRTLEQAAARYGGYDKLESKIANQITNLNDWQQLTEATQAKIMIMTGINFDGMTKAEQEKTINHLQHSPLPFGEIEEVLSTSVKIELGYTHTLDKTKSEVKDLGEGIWEIKLISNNNNGSHTGHNLGSFRIDLGKNGNADIAKQVGNQMVQNTNDNNKLYLDSAARDVLYGRVERNDFDMDSAYEQGGIHGGFNHVYGTNGDDRLEGSDGNDQMHGKGGNDVFYGGKGDDQFLGDGGDYNQADFDGNSADWKVVRNADGTVTATHAEYGAKLLSNIDGAWFFGDSKYYTVDQLVEGIDNGGGETGNEITGTDGDDYLVGTDGDDVIKGGDGVDVIFAGAGDDTIDGEGGDYNQVDLLGASTDYTFTKNDDGSVTAVHAEHGTKILSNIDGAWFIGDEKWSSVDDLLGSGGGGDGETGETITGTAGDDYLVGTDGDDVIKGGEGMDVIFAGAGNDNIDGEGGDYNQVDLLGNSTDYTFTQNDDGTVSAAHAEYGTKTLSNIDGAWFTGDQKWSSVNDLLPEAEVVGKTITGTSGDDYLVGTDGDDVILGGDGNDVMHGGKGDDTYDGQGGDYNQVDFEGKSSDYTFTKNEDGTITAEHAEYGKDILKEIDGVWFSGDNVWSDVDDMVA